MKRKSEFLPASKLVQQKHNESLFKTVKSRNVPSEIWLKRNVLKKLSLQMKFNKPTALQHKMFNETGTQPEPNELKTITSSVLKQNQSQILAPPKENTMRKLSSAKAENTTKYTENFFASNAFSKKGLKSYLHKSSMCQGNNFINVSKAIILEKRNLNQQSQTKSYHRRTSSHTKLPSKGPDEKKIEMVHKRSFSAHPSNKEDKLGKKTDFLKVTSKQIHFNSIDAFLMGCTRDRQFLNRRSKTQVKTLQVIETPKKVIIQPKPKVFSLSRPKSCVVKPNKSLQLTNCQGWITVTGQDGKQEEPFFNILEF